ncbi:hypothetical protein [Paenibacillus sp. HB172176]|uniref:hypothetical protein n=1 Tax=Paenibacillus sp. HB172176 TaxID=2493690 RepID=UPI00143AC3A5|nr:hypothetical protein [Paenibacillus sp. HB172176]
MRAASKRRPPIISLKKSLLLLLAFLVTVSVWFIFYLRDIQEPQRQEADLVKSWSVNQERLKSIDDVLKHIWEDTTWIVQGENEEGEKVFLFEREQELLVQVKASEALSKEQMEARFKQSKPQAEIVRITPGFYNNAPIWEIYYKQNEGNGGVHAYYAFYSFDLQGSLLQTYILPAKAGL